MYFGFQEALGSLSSSNGSDRNFSKESKKAEKMASSPPPKPQLPVQPATSVSAIEANKEAATTLDDSAKKPDWLAELSRKQVRKWWIYDSSKSCVNNSKNFVKSELKKGYKVLPPLNIFPFPTLLHS